MPRSTVILIVEVLSRILLSKDPAKAARRAKAAVAERAGRKAIDDYLKRTAR